MFIDHIWKKKDFKIDVKLQENQNKYFFSPIPGQFMPSSYLRTDSTV